MSSSRRRSVKSRTKSSPPSVATERGSNNGGGQQHQSSLRNHQSASFTSASRKSAHTKQSQSGAAPLSVSSPDIPPPLRPMGFSDAVSPSPSTTGSISPSSRSSRKSPRARLRPPVDPAPSPAGPRRSPLSSPRAVSLLSDTDPVSPPPVSGGGRLTPPPPLRLSIGGSSRGADSDDDHDDDDDHDSPGSQPAAAVLGAAPLLSGLSSQSSSPPGATMNGPDSADNSVNYGSSDSKISVQGNEGASASTGTQRRDWARLVRLGPRVGEGAGGVVYKGLQLDTGNLVAVKVVRWHSVQSFHSDKQQQQQQHQQQRVSSSTDLDPVRGRQSSEEDSNDPKHWRHVSHLDGPTGGSSNPGGSETPPANVQQIRKEIDLMSSLSHPNVVRYLGSAVLADRIHVYLEYVAGGSISGALREFGPLPERPVVQHYVRQLLAGLAYLHRQAVVHRDIKCSNVLLVPDGTVKLADFGSAKLLASLSANRTLVGTPAFLAPEIIMSVGHGRPADMWSLGCCIIEMVGGRPPHSDLTDVAAIMFRIANSSEPPKPPPGASPELASMLLRCFFRDPAARSTAEELMTDPWVAEAL